MVSFYYGYNDTLYQILASQHISFDNVIVPASLYDNQNAIQLLKTFEKKYPDLRFIKLENSLRVEHVFWSAIVFPQDTHLNSFGLKDGGSWPVPIISTFSKFIQSFVNTSQKASFKKIYLKRSRLLRRQCTNIDEVENLIIDRFGFEPVELENYSFKDQVSILNSCDFIVGPSGAAWTNIIFCDIHKYVKAICWGLPPKHKELWQPLAKSSNVSLTTIITTDPNTYCVNCKELSEQILTIIGQNY